MARRCSSASIGWCLPTAGRRRCREEGGERVRGARAGSVSAGVRRSVLAQPDRVVRRDPQHGEARERRHAQRAGRVPVTTSPQTMHGRDTAQHSFDCVTCPTKLRKVAQKGRSPPYALIPLHTAPIACSRTPKRTYRPSGVAAWKPRAVRCLQQIQQQHPQQPHQRHREHAWARLEVALMPSYGGRAWKSSAPENLVRLEGVRSAEPPTCHARRGAREDAARLGRPVLRGASLGSMRAPARGSPPRAC